MPNNKAKYYRIAPWLAAMLLLLVIVGCKVYPSLHSNTYNEPALREELSLSPKEKTQLYDSCGLVLHPEWDSVMQVMADPMSVNPMANALADSIIAYAMEYMHTPYHLGGNGPHVFDCSGFTKYVFRRFGYSLQRTVPGQLSDGWKIIDNQEDLRRGDLAFFGGRAVPTQMGHVAIVVDNDPEAHSFTFIHATLKRGIIISESNEKYYKTRYMTACRILPE